jgi:Ca2+-binding RTX toxin-like protein
LATINGSQFDDTLQGFDSGTVYFGLAGDDDIYGGPGDTLYGGDGADYLGAGGSAVVGATSLFGGEGDDEFFGSDGNDVLDGGDGNDVFVYTGGRDQAIGGLGTDSIALGTLFGAVNFTLGVGGKGKLVVTSEMAFTPGILTYSGIEGVEGGGYNDTLRGNEGDNSFYGNLGTDQIFGMAGNDLLIGAEGHDTLSGGRGADAFAFTGDEDRRKVADSADLITDFDATQDRLVFFSRTFTGLHTASSAADATVAGTPLFNILASEFAVQTTRHAATSGVRVIYDSDDGLLYYDADGALSGYRPRLVADIGANHALTAADIFIY